MSPLSRFWGYGALLATAVLFAIIRTPFMARSARTAVKERRMGPWEGLLQPLIGLGMFGLPLVAALGRLRFADQPMTAWRLAAGAAVMVGALVLFYRSHADLGTNWSYMVVVKKEHTLVSSGVYARIRHPMYASLLLSTVGQVFLVPNWIGGLSGLVALALFLSVRIRAEERMMEQTFGDAYLSYERRTGRLWPKPRRPQ